MAALVAALAGALTSMVAGLTVGREGYAPAEREMQDLRQLAEGLRRDLTAFVEEDCLAWQEVLAARRLPRSSPEGQAARQKAFQAALRHATNVPLAVADRGVKVLELLPAVIARGFEKAVCDAGVAAYLAQAAVRGAALDVRANAASIADEELAANFREQAENFVAQANRLAQAVEEAVADRLGHLA